MSAVFGYECWNLGDDLKRGLLLWKQQGNVKRFGFAKVAVGQEKMVGALLEHNFRLIETQVVFKYKPHLARTPPRGADRSLLTIRPMTSDYAPFIGELAAKSFGNSRFHQDMKIPTGVADEVKRQWGKNLAMGSRPSESYVCLDGKKSIVGFVSLVKAGYIHDLPAYAIDLIAVDEVYQKVGIGSLLLNHVQTLTSEKNVILVAGTQASNKPAINLYQRNEMTLFSTSYVLHAHEPSRPQTTT